VDHDEVGPEVEPKMRGPESIIHVCSEVERTEQDFFLSGERQGLRVDEIGGAVLFSCSHIPVGMLNYATGVSTRSADLDELLDKIEDFYTRLNVLPRIAITPLSRPKDLSSRLLRRGYKESSISDVMIIDSEVTRRATRSDVKVWLVQGGQVEAFSSIFNNAFKIPADLRGAFARFWRSTVFDSDPRLRIYLATLKGKPAGVGLIFIEKQAAGLYSVATKPESQGKGVATNLTSQAVQDAFTSKAKFVYLYASRKSGTSEKYRSLGFTSRYLRAVYSFRPSGELDL